MNSILTLGRVASWYNFTARSANEGVGGLVLDVATGTGELAFYLAREPQVKTVVGADFCFDMISNAQHKTTQRKLNTKVAFTIADGLILPFADTTFASSTIGFALRNVSDIHQMLAEMYRVVLPGGRVVCLELTPLAPGLLATAFRWYLSRLVPILGRCVAGNFNAYAYLYSSLAGFPSADELKSMMESVGLQEVNYRLLAFGSVAIHKGIR
jgi:demethylmenaquinone methyltransferase/2-methoxy-6-polyprenyl-1,4-benzoquinol methylase